MKNLRNYYLSVLMIAGLGFMSSCGDDDEPEPEKNPTVELAAGSQYTTADKNVVGGSDFETRIIANSNTSTKTNLKNFKVTVSYDGAVAQTVIDSTISKESFDYTFKRSTRFAAGKETWAFTITDRDGLFATKSFTLTTTDPNAASTYKTFTATLLGAQSNTSGSFFSTQDGTVRTVSEAKANQTKIDFLYFFGSTNKATIAAPNDADANTISTLQLNSWTAANKKATKFVSASSANYDAGIDANTIGNAYDAAAALSTEASKINDLAVGEVFGFKTAEGKKGLAKVVAISAASATGTITLDIKVQK